MAPASFFSLQCCSLHVTVVSVRSPPARSKGLVDAGCVPGAAGAAGLRQTGSLTSQNSRPGDCPGSDWCGDSSHAVSGALAVPGTHSWRPKYVVVSVFIQFCSVQSLSRVQLFATPWTAAHQASLSITNFQSLLKLMSIKSVMPCNHLILCHPLLLLPSILPSIRGFSNGSVLHLRWPKYWSFNFRISPSNEYSGLTSLRMD